jgi:hypothetical protein
MTIISVNAYNNISIGTVNAVSTFGVAANTSGIINETESDWSVKSIATTTTALGINTALFTFSVFH